MNFEWDDAKRLTNIPKHGFDFVGIKEVFDGQTVTILDDRFDYGEIRFITLGPHEGFLVAIAHTESDTLIRIISVRKGLELMKKKSTTKKSQTDWKRISKLKDEDIDMSDIPEVTPEMFARGVIRKGLKEVPRKTQLTIRVDTDVLEWYRKQGSGYQTRINALLRAYMEAHQQRSK